MRNILTASIFIFAFCAFAFGQNSKCPAVSVIGSASVPVPGETITFSVNVDNEAQDANLQYVWSVSSGKIVEGQGTKVITVGEITVDFSGTATVEIKGLPKGCANTASETATICFGMTKPILFDESEISSKYLSSEKLNALISELEKNSDEMAYFIVYSHKKDSLNELQNKEDHIRNYLRVNKIDSERMVFVTVDGDQREAENSVVRIWLVPPGAEPPTP